MKQGLLDEIRSLQNTLSLSQPAVNSSLVDVNDEPGSSATDLDYTLGIYQCIGARNLLPMRTRVIFADRIQGIPRVPLDAQWS